MPTSRKRKKKGIKKKRHPNHSNLPSGAYERINEKLKKNGINSKLSRKGHKHRISELVLDFLSQELAYCDTEEEERKLVSLGIICWNIGNFNKEQREEQIQSVLEGLSNEIGAAEGMEVIIRDLVNKKVKYFSKYRYIITSYDISLTPEGSLYLTVASSKI